jgi:hypothetical protein
MVIALLSRSVVVASALNIVLHLTILAIIIILKRKFNISQNSSLDSNTADLDIHQKT